MLGEVPVGYQQIIAIAFVTLFLITFFFFLMI